MNAANTPAIGSTMFHFFSGSEVEILSAPRPERCTPSTGDVVDVLHRGRFESEVRVDYLRATSGETLPALRKAGNP